MEPKSIAYANYETIKPYLSGEQRRWAKANQEEENCNWLVTFHLIHNDGPNVRVDFRINGKPVHCYVTADIPLELFNRLPKIKVAA